jgi:hypothetical protein
LIPGRRGWPLSPKLPARGDSVVAIDIYAGPERIGEQPAVRCGRPRFKSDAVADEENTKRTRFGDGAKVQKRTQLASERNVPNEPDSLTS